MIETRDLKKNFGDLKVLKGVSQSINKGEKVVIIGPSGSGKSTYLRCLNLLETPDSGEIYIDGIDILDKKNDINKKFGKKSQMLCSSKIKFNFKTDSGVLNYLNSKFFTVNVCNF